MNNSYNCFLQLIVTQKHKEECFQYTNLIIILLIKYYQACM